VVRLAAVGAALAVAAGAAGGFTLAWQLQAGRQAAAELERKEVDAEAQRLQARALFEAGTQHELARAALTRRMGAIRQETDRAIAAAPDWYAGPCLDDDGLRSVARALQPPGGADPAQPAPALPRASAAP
jgi:hypothetical protein